MKKYWKIAVAALAAAGLLGACANAQTPAAAETKVTETEAAETTAEETAAEQTTVEESTETVSADGGITIVYTNDIHSYIANEKTREDSSAPKEDGLRLSKISQMVKDMEADGKKVLLVDAGDQVQGCSFGAIDEGVSVIDIMNAAGYDLATMGNHEFDYGTNQLFKLVDEANYPYVSCNFYAVDESEENQPFKDYEVFEFDGKKLAIIGVTTPETITSSTPVYFQDSKGNYIYDVEGTKEAQDLYDSVQRAIDQVKDDVDYIVALGHVGVGLDEERNHIRSIDIIEHTSGLDAFIDGHSHTTMENNAVKDQEGNEVVLTQTGSYLNAVGVMEIAADGTISTKLVNDYESEDENTAAVEKALIDKVNETLGQKIAVLDTPLYINNPQNEKQRLIRARELNAGDFVTDSVYWYFNEIKDQQCDLVLLNGGGIRSQTNAGDITEQNVKDVQPFGNMICMIYATGQQIKDALEMGTTVTGVYDEQWDAPAENGGFMQVAGMRYTIDPSVESSVKTDEAGNFLSIDGDYRVKDIEIYNKETASYEPIDLEKMYTVGGINYLLRNGGSGLTMFTECEMVIDYVGQDCEILSAYVKSFEKNGEYSEVNTANSALSSYESYQIDYENGYGAGRITILGIEE